MNKISIFAVIVKNVLSYENQNIFQLYNESDFIEIINGSSLFDLSPNLSHSKTNSQTNGRLRSFLAEEEEEDIITQKLFGKYSRFSILFTFDFIVYQILKLFRTFIIVKPYKYPCKWSIMTNYAQKL